MIDPREDKLPKWARDLLAAERLQGALGWPTATRPTPAAELCVAIGGSTYLLPGYYWRSTGAQFGYQSHATAKKVWVERWREFNVRPPTGAPWSASSWEAKGPYFDTETDALLEAWWQEADAAAKRLREVRREYEEAARRA